jgi:hypothetical protein
MPTPWDAHTYDRTSEPQQAWASEVLADYVRLNASAVRGLA